MEHERDEALLAKSALEMSLAKTMGLLPVRHHMHASHGLSCA